MKYSVWSTMHLGLLYVGEQHHGNHRWLWQARLHRWRLKRRGKRVWIELSKGDGYDVVVEP